MAHAPFSPSAAHRWLNCPGSWRKEQDYPDETSEFAAEGTAAHQLAQMVLEGLGTPEDFVGQTIDADGFEFTITAEMAGFVREYTDYCFALMEMASFHEVESWSEFAEGINGWQECLRDCYGTSDFVALVGGTLHVVDLKYGRGVRVSPEGNEQLMIYGAAQLSKAVERGSFPVKAVLTIIQPRLSPEPASYEVTTEELIEFVEGRLIPGIEACKAPDAPLVAGDWCKFCKFRNECSARRDQALAVAQTEFALQPVETLGVVELSNALKQAETLASWIEGVREHLLNLAKQGVPVPGFKVVAKVPRRQWTTTDEAKIIYQLRKAHPEMKPSAWYEKKFISVAQAEKIVGKKGLPEKLVASVSSGFTLAPETDKRPAVKFTAAQDEFTAEALNHSEH